MSQLLSQCLNLLGRSRSEYDETILGKYSGKAVVCASGSTLWEDLKKVGFTEGKWDQNFDVITVNRVLSDIPCRVSHAWSNHFRQLMDWHAARDETKLMADRKGPKIRFHSTTPYKGMTAWKVPGHGTSTLNAIYLGCLLGYDEIYVCGAPMDSSPRYYEPPWHKSIFEHEGLHKPWRKAGRELKNVYGMSGYSKEFFGAD